MRHLLFFYFFTIPYTLLAQSQVIGKFIDNNGNSIDINSDSTFKFRHRIHLSESWTNGVWKINKDTIFFLKTAVYDTLVHIDLKNNITKSLILSEDDKIDVIEHYEGKPFSLQLTTQYVIPCPEKLFYHKNKLFRIVANGKLLMKKQKSAFSNKKTKSWFYKIG